MSDATSPVFDRTASISNTGQHGHGAERSWRDMSASGSGDEQRVRGGAAQGPAFAHRSESDERKKRRPSRPRRRRRSRAGDVKIEPEEMSSAFWPCPFRRAVWRAGGGQGACQSAEGGVIPKFELKRARRKAGETWAPWDLSANGEKMLFGSSRNR